MVPAQLAQIARALLVLATLVCLGLAGSSGGPLLW
jgi:hypothetical protein